MQLLLCSAGKERYAIDAEYIFVVVPKVALKELPHTERYVAGLLNYGSHPVPIVDFCELITGHPCANLLHTRIILLNSNSNQSDVLPVVGIMAEKVTQTLEKDKVDFLESGVRIKDFSFLGGVLNENSELIQLIYVDELMKFLQGALQFKTSV